MELHVDEEVRQKARAIFSRLGLSEEEAVTLFYKRTIAEGRLPFGRAENGTGRIKKKRMNERFAKWDAR